MTKLERPVAVFYEHPKWFRFLFQELDRRGIPYVRLDAAEHTFCVDREPPPWSLVLNRMSPSAYLRGRGHLISYTSQFLDHLERHGVRVVNGSKAFSFEISKAKQLALLRELDLPHPPSRVIHSAEQAPKAAEGLRFPVLVKANVGGSGAGIHRFDSPEELKRAAREGLDLGPDHTALVQEYHPLRNGAIVRVEVLGGEFLYAIQVHTAGETFDLCPADICKTPEGEELAVACPVDAAKRGLTVERFTPPPEVVDQVETLMAAAGIEVGGVEYLVDDRDGRLLYYDVNALSNFVADGERLVGFDPFVKLVDFLERQREEACASVTGFPSSAAG